MSYVVNKIVSLPRPKFRASIDLELIKLIETITPFSPVSHLDYRELPAKDNRLRFYVKTAYNERDRSGIHTGKKWDQRSINKIEAMFLSRDYWERCK